MREVYSIYLQLKEITSARITGGDRGISPPLPIVVPGTKTALNMVSPLKMGWALKKISYLNVYLPSTFLPIRALERTHHVLT